MGELMIWAGLAIVIAVAFYIDVLLGSFALGFTLITIGTLYVMTTDINDSKKKGGD